MASASPVPIPSSAGSGAPMSTAAPSIAAGKKTLRRNFMYLCSDPKLASELDRFMIAMHLFQTKGRVAYRRLMGMHGGGGGTSDPEYQRRMKEKVMTDVKINHGGKPPVDYWWPDPVPNADIQKITSAEDSPFTYTFCYHGEPEFIVWHRPFMMEFERGLQEFDPAFAPGNLNRHVPGPKALGMPYWAWETWDGMTLPSQITTPAYIIRSTAWAEVGFVQGSIIANPLHQWYAPVSVEDQLLEKFPPYLNSTTSNTRAASFTDPTILNELVWPIKPQNAGSGYPSMNEVVMHAIGQANWKLFCTTKPLYGNSTWSIENAHNKFHNHIGGYTIGGVTGNGQQKVDGVGTFSGTMTSNQSVFDPIFWLHHSNVERQLCSWQSMWFPGGMQQPPKEAQSQPEKELMSKVLLPWTTPALIAEGSVSWNTDSGDENNGTFADWFNMELSYEYEEYLKPVLVTESVDVKPLLHLPVGPFFLQPVGKPERRRVRLIASLAEHQRSGEFTVFFENAPKATVSILTAVGTGCARCQGRKEFLIDFDVTQSILFDASELDDKMRSKLTLRRNDVEIRTPITWSAVNFGEEASFAASK